MKLIEEINKLLEEQAKLIEDINTMHKIVKLQLEENEKKKTTLPTL